MSKSSHLKVYEEKDGSGWYVRRGKRGGLKERLLDCEITSFDGEATLYSFRLTSVVEFEAEMQRRFNAKYGISAEG